MAFLRLIYAAAKEVNGTWKFKHLHAFNRMLAPYEEEWEVQSKVGDVPIQLMIPG